MSKKIIILSLVLSFSFLLSTKILGHPKSTTQEVALTKENLSKKWFLDKYVILGQSSQPEANEKNDFILLNKNMTYQSISEGAKDVGSWSLNTKTYRIILKSNTKNGALIFAVKLLTKNRLIMIIDDQEDEDTRYIKIHFVTNKSRKS